jgi:hypothetical protein
MQNIKSELLNVYLKEFEKYHDLAVDWLILSWKKKAEEKEKALLEYKKWKKRAFEIAYKMDTYING